MTSIGERLKSRRSELGLTQDDVAHAVARRVTDMKYSRISVSNLELGIQSSVKDKVLIAMSELLKCRPEWLAFGELPVELSPAVSASICVKPGPTVEQKCPLITWKQASSFTEASDYPETDFEYYPCPVRCGPRTYILRVLDESMMDRFYEGDLIYVDPDQIEPRNGQFVIAQIDESSEVSFKQLQLLDGQRILKSLANYPPELKYIKLSGNSHLIGTVIAHVKSVP